MRTMEAPKDTSLPPAAGGRELCLFSAGIYSTAPAQSGELNARCGYDLQSVVSAGEEPSSVPSEI